MRREKPVLKSKQAQMSGAPFEEQWDCETDPEGRETGWKLILRSEGGRIEKACAVCSFSFEKEDRLFLNGYQSWTFSRERGTREFDHAMRWCPGVLDRRFGFSAYGDGTFYKEPYRKGVQHGYSYGYVRRGTRFCFFGSLSEDTGFTRIIFDTNSNTVIFEKDCRGRVVRGDYTALHIRFYEGTEQEVFDAWFADLKVQPLTGRKLTGYTSWYNYYQNISAQILLRDAAGMGALPEKPDLFQIDDGYETAVGDWRSVDPVKFPEGLACVIREIRKQGMEGGIWMAPFVCEKNSALYREHPGWLLRDDQGAPVFGGCNWSGMYALDIYQDEVRAYVKECIRTYREMGFTLFKLDFLYAACLLPRPDKTRGEVMRDGMDLLREACGACAILGCGVPLASAFGKTEYCRIGMDMSLSWDDAVYMRPFHSERPSTRHTMQNTLWRRQLSGRAFLNDPDVFLLRKDNIRLREREKLALAKLNALLGGVLFTSDNCARYDERQRRRYGRLLRLRDARLLDVREKSGRITVRYCYPPGPSAGAAEGKSADRKAKKIYSVSWKA